MSAAGRTRGLSGPVLLALAALGAAGCERTRDESCPGELLVALALHGELDASATGCAVAPAVGWNVPPALPRPATAEDPTPTFEAAFVWSEGTQQLAYCTPGEHSAVLRGTRSGDHLRVLATVPGAALGECAPTCAPLMTVVIEGDLSSGTSPATFTGTLTETLEGGAGPCAPCQLPCRSTYRLTGTER